MIIEKVLNNNTVVVIDPKTNKEIILVGCGLAFNKKAGQAIDDEKVEKTFVIENKRMGNKLKKLINQIPDGIFEMSHVIICKASNDLNRSLDKQVYISLSDHISFAIKRYKKNILIKNHFLDEIRRVHKDEYKVSLWAVEYLNEKLKINLPEDEAGFIALHLVNAGNRDTSKESLEGTNIIKGILNIIRYYYSVEFNEDDLNYDRLLTHLKFFAKRVLTEDKQEKGDRALFELAEKNYSEAFECSIKIKDYIENNYSYKVNEDEIVYLTIHIHRVISVLRENI